MPRMRQTGCAGVVVRAYGMHKRIYLRLKQLCSLLSETGCYRHPQLQVLFQILWHLWRWSWIKASTGERPLAALMLVLMVYTTQGRKGAHWLGCFANQKGFHVTYKYKIKVILCHMQTQSFYKTGTNNFTIY